MQRLKNNLHIEKKCIIIIGMKGWEGGNRIEPVQHPSEEKFFEHCTNCAILPRPLSRDHFCENLASLLFQSSAGERLQLISTQSFHHFGEMVLLSFNYTL